MKTKIEHVLFDFESNSQVKREKKMIDSETDDIRKEIVDSLKSGNFDEFRQKVQKISPNQIIDKNGNSILSFLAFRGCEDEACWYLAKHQPPTNVKNKDGKTPLILSVEKGLHGLMSSLSVMDGLNEVDNNGRSALTTAVLNDDESSVRVLLTRNISIDQIDHFGFSPLAYAFLSQNLKLVEILIDATMPKATTFLINNLPDEMIYYNFSSFFPYKTTLLHMSVFTDNMDLLIIALKLTSDLSQKDSNGLTPLDLAAKMKMSDFVYILSSLGSQNPFFEAIEKDDYKTFCELLDSYGNSVNKNGETALHIAAKYDRTDMIKVLSSRFPPVPDFNGFVPYNYATSQSKEILKQRALTYSVRSNKSFNLDSSMIRIRFGRFIAYHKNELSVLHVTLKSYNLKHLRNHPAGGVGLMLLEKYPEFNKYLDLLQFDYDIAPLERFVEKIIHSSLFDQLINGLGEASQVAKAHDLDNPQLWFVYAAIFTWIRTFAYIFFTSTNVFDFPPMSITSILQHILPMQGQVDEVLYSWFSKNRTDIPMIKKVLIFYKVLVSEAQPYQQPFFPDHSFRSKINELFGNMTEQTLMLPPSQKFIQDGQYLLIVSERILVMVAQGNTSYVIPLFGLYIKPSISAKEIRLVWHAGSMKLRFEDISYAKFFIHLINSSVKKYQIYEVFLSKDENKNKPFWLVFSYLKKGAIYPSLSIKTVIVKNNNELIDEIYNYSYKLSNILPDSFRCHPFKFLRDQCSPSLL